MPANEKEVLGLINCPVCGYKDGMVIKPDKNGAPFGNCAANCDAQLRVGGKQSRVEQFFKLYGHLRRPGETPPPVTVTGGAVPDTALQKDVSETAPNHAKIPVTVTGTKPQEKPKRAAFSLEQL